MTPLKAARVARGWSQDKLAKLAGLPQPTISRAERNGSATTDIALRIAAALESTVEDLFDTKAVAESDAVEVLHDAAPSDETAAA